MGRPVTTLGMKLQPGFRCSSLGSLDTGGGGGRHGEIPLKCHDNPGVWYTAVVNTGDGQIPGCSFILSVDYAVGATAL